MGALHLLERIIAWHFWNTFDRSNCAVTIMTWIHLYCITFERRGAMVTNLDLLDVKVAIIYVT